MLLCHVEAHVVHRGLGLIDKHEVGGTERCHLACNLRADAARRTRDEHAATGYHLADGFHIHLNLLSWQEVFYVHGAQLVLCKVRLAVPFLGQRHHHYLYSCGDKGVDEGGAVGELFCLERRHEQHSHVLRLHRLHDAVLVLIHTESQKVETVLYLLRGDESFQTEPW